MALHAPKLSIILIAYSMSRQLENTLYTLTADYQQGVTVDDYEVIVIENNSGDALPRDLVASLPANFRYLLRNEDGVSPVHAVNEGFAMSRAPFICLMVDGARMASPGIVRTALQAYAISRDVVVAVPGYHLGTLEQHLVDGNIDPFEVEASLLATVDWRSDGYELFSISTFSGANAQGFLNPIMECNCMFASADNFAAIGHADANFQQPGGGSINLHMYRSLGMLRGTEFFVLPGEGSFHQYHGGVTTSSYEDREAEIARHRVQLHSFWPDGFHSLRREAQLLGRVPPQARSFLVNSLQLNERRLKRLQGLGQEPWPDDVGDQFS